MLEDHDMKDRQVHARLQPVILGISGLLCGDYGRWLLGW